MDKRESILEATLKLASKFGIEGVSTALISKEAEVGMGTIYRYFESKEKLLYSLFNNLREKLNVLVLSSFTIGLSPYDNFEKVVRSLLEYYSANIDEFKFLENYSDSRADIPERLDDSLLPLEPIANFLNGYDSSLKLKPLPIDVIFALIYGPLIAIVNLIHMNKLKLTDEMIVEISRSCWDSISKK